MKKYSRLLPITFMLCLSIAATGQIIPDFHSDDQVVCPGAPVAFSSLSSIPAGYTPTYLWTFSGGFAASLTDPNTTVFYYTPGVYSVSLTVCAVGLPCQSITKTAYITVVTPPDASFNTSYPNLCNKLSVAFNNTSVAGGGAITSYLWDFGDGTFSTTASPTKLYAAAGTYSVILFISDANGCSDNYTVNVTTYAPLSSSMTATGSLFSCGTPISPTFTATSSGGTPPYSYSWDYGNGTTGNLASATVTYSPCGSYDISYTVTDANGCTVSHTYNDYVTISCPVANFTMTPSPSCDDATVNFTNLSTPGAISYYWQFNYPSIVATSALSNPSYFYASPGSKVVKLTVTYPGGCTAVHFDTIEILARPAIGGIAATDTFGCDVPFITTLSAYGVSGAAPITYSWNVGGATYTGANPTITLYGVTNYDVTLTITDANGCSTAVTQPGFIKIKKATNEFTATPLSGCAPVLVTFNNTSSSLWVPLAYFVWDYDDGSVDTTYTLGAHTHIFTESGDYHVQMTLYTEEGCPKTESVTIEVGHPVAYFELASDADPICNPVLIDNMSYGSESTSVDWGDGINYTLDTPLQDTMHFYEIGDTTTFIITMTAEQNGCLSHWSDTVNVIPVPTLATTIWDCDDPTVLTITVDTSGFGGSFCWDFGAGDTLCNINPVTIDFGATGGFIVHLTTEDTTTTACSAGNSFLAVVPDLTASFSMSDVVGCEDMIVNFDNTSEITYLIGTSYTWTIGPGLITGITSTVTSYVPDYSYHFTEPDIYPVSLTITDALGCQNTYTDTVILGHAISAFAIDSIIGCGPRTVYFSDASEVPITPDDEFYIEQWIWDFDGACPTYYGQDPPPCVMDNEVYNISLSIADNYGCHDTYVFPLDLTGVVHASYIGDTLSCNAADPLHFENTSSGDFTSIFWDFGDGTSDTTLHADHNYLIAGSYNVSLTVSDTLGCISTFTDSLSIAFDNLAAGFDLDYLTPSTCPPIPVQLTNTSTGDIASIEWTIEREMGVFNYYEDTLIFSYTVPGDYDATIVATSSHGCIDTFSVADILHIPGPSGVMTYGPLSGCAPLDVSFDLGAIDADLSYIDFGDGDTILVNADLNHTYVNEGTYCPSLILIDSTGCLFQVACDAPLSTFGSPEAHILLSDTDVCLGDTVWLSNLSLATPGAPFTDFSVNFGDGTPPIILGDFDSIMHIFYTSGIFNVSLVAHTALCSDSTFATVYSNSIPSAIFDYDPEPGCAPLTVDFLIDGDDTDDVYIDFGDGTNAIVSGDTAHTYTTSGSFIPSIILNNTSGCSQAIIGDSPIVVGYPSIAAIYLSDSTLCLGESLELYNTSWDTIISPIAHYIINFGDGTPTINVPTLDSLSHTYMSSGDYSIHFVVINTSGCSDDVVMPVSISPNPYSILDYSALPGCYDLPVDFSLIGLIADIAILDFGDGSVDTITGDVSHIYTEAGIFTPSLHLNTVNGCALDIIGDEPIIVGYPSSAGMHFSDSAICYGAPITIYNDSWDTLITPITSYTINFGDGEPDFISPAFDSTTYTYLTSGTYNVQLSIINTSGCTDNITIPITINPTPVAIFDYAPPAGCFDLPVDFNLSGLDADEAILNYGDGTSDTIDADITHIYTSGGTFYPSLTLQNISGCSQILSGIDTINVGIPSLAGMSLSDTSICAGSYIKIFNTSWDTIFTPITNYIVDFGDGTPIYTAASLDSITHTYATAGTYNLQLTTYNSSGCEDNVSTPVVVNPVPSASLAIEPTLGCGTLTAIFTLSDLSADSTFLNTGESIEYLTGTSYAYTYNTPGVFYPSVHLQNTSGCYTDFIGNDSIVLSYQPQAIMLLSDSMPYCTGQEIYVISLSLDTVSNPFLNPIDLVNVDVNGVSIYSDTWLDSVSYTFSTAGDYVIEMVTSNDLGCSDTVSTSFTVHETPVAVAGYDTVVCPGISIMLDGSSSSGGSYFNWYPSTYLSNASDVYPVGTFPSTSLIYLNYSNDYCSAIDSVLVTVLTTLNLQAGPDTAICLGNSVQLYSLYDSVGGDVSVAWEETDFLNNPYINNPICTPDNSITYTLSASCGTLTDLALVSVIVNPLPEVDIIDSATMVLENPILLNALGSGGTGFLSYSWFPEDYLSCPTCASTWANPPDNINYWIIVSDENQCTGIDSIALRVVWECAGEGIEVANILSPNGDGYNDKFQFRTEAIKQLDYFRIYDRWGEMLFESTDPLVTWDGTYNGTIVQQGVYLYEIKGVCFDDLPFVKSGNVTLVK